MLNFAARTAAALATSANARLLWRSVLHAEMDAHTPDFTSVVDAVIAARASADPHRAALDWLLDLWKSHVEEPPHQGWERIDDLIRGPLGLGWGTADAVNWTPNQRYESETFLWCGATVARALGEFGLLAEIRRKHVASTYRLHAFCRGTDRMVELDNIQPGDIVITGNGRKRVGDHITMAMRVDDGLVYTVEGNAHGRLPDGNVAEGVVMRTHPLPKSAGGPGRAGGKCPVSGLPFWHEVLWAYRFLPEDFA